jgi:hypothetical protein
VRTRFQKELLPPARDFYEKELEKLSRPNRAGWCACCCPFHKSKSGKSFAININHGGWVCRAGCGSGDIPGFVMLRDGCDFPTACKTLACWQDVGEEERLKLGSEAAERKRERESAAQVKEAERARRLALRDEIHNAVQIQAEASARLDELLQDAAPAYENEMEDWWAVLALAQSDLHDCESPYMNLIGIEYLG